MADRAESVKPQPRRWRVRIIAGGLSLALLAFWGWTPGAAPGDGRHDLRRNALWLQHGWLGDDAWFQRQGRQAQIPDFRSPARLKALTHSLHQRHIQDIYPHLCPSSAAGDIAPWDPEQMERLLDHSQGLRVMPWIGGVWGHQARPEDPTWRRAFVASAARLLAQHPRLAGVHVNIEPIPSQSQGFLALLEELRAALPGGKLISVSAHPPALPWSTKHGWSQDDYRQVARRADQVVAMTYNSGLVHEKLYTRLMEGWTHDVLEATRGQGAQVLLGVPTYEDEGWHHRAQAEHMGSALRGIHAGLLRQGALPEHYQGAAVYSEWVTDEQEWSTWRELWLAP